MTAHELLHRLLYRGLVEIRYAAHDGETNRVFDLADLLHNLPLRLAYGNGSERSCNEALTAIRQRAADRGLEDWLERVLTQEAENVAGTAQAVT